MIKKLLFAAILIISSLSFAQAQQFNYQGIARNANGVAITFQDISIRLSIRDLIILGPILYSETRVVRTNQFGMINIVIGSPGATNTIGSMSGINWASGAKYLQVEIDPLGGSSFQAAGTSQLQSVPFAMFANAAYPIGAAGGDLLGSTYPNPIIAPLAVSTIKLKDSAVTTPKIADSAITNSKILSNAVTTEKIMDSAVITSKLRNKNVTTEKIADSAITSEKIKNNAVTNEKIADGTIQNIKLVNSSFTLNGLVLNLGGSQSFIVDSAGTNVTIVSTGSTHTFNFPNASIANRGLITSNTQTIGGNKIFNNDITAARIIRAGGIAAQFLKADGSVDNNIYLTANQPIIVTAIGDATGISTSSGTAPVLPLTLATVNSTVGTYGTSIVIPSITVNSKGLITNVIANPIPTATSTELGLLTAANWNTFNNKQNAIPLGTTAQYFRGDLSLSNFQTDVRAQLSAGTNITYANGQFGVTNNSVTLNALPLTLGGSQTFATGTGGIDFNISSLGTVHTFNIPSASTFARGLLTNTDFTNFNAAYTNRISSLTTTGPNGPATIASNILNIPTYTLPAATGTTLGGTIIGANISNTGGTISLSSTNITNALGSQSPNLVLASPNGVNGTPFFRSLVAADVPILNQNTSGSAGSVTNALTFNNSGAGVASGDNYNGSSPKTISYNSLGASPLAGSSSIITVGAISTGNWQATPIGSNFGGAGTINGILKANGSGIVSQASVGIDYLSPFASQTQKFVFAAPNAAPGTPSFRALLASDIPTLNQNTTGSAATLTTSRNIYGNSFNGLTDVTGVIASTFGGTGNGFTRFNGPTTMEKTFTLPNSNATILTDAAAVTILQGGTGATTKTAAFDALSPMTTLGDIIYGAAGGTGTSLPAGSNGQILTLSAGLLPIWSNPASNNQWSILGNIGLVNGTHFLGTTDNSALRLRVNNLWAGELNPITSNTSFGIGAGQNNSSSIANTNNTAFGVGALNQTSSNGTDNTAVGHGALLFNINGDNNTAMGQGALNGAFGNSNTAMGQAALRLNVTDRNTAIGRAALETSTLADNTALGYIAGRNFGATFDDLNQATNIVRSVMIGSNTRTQTINSDNEIVIGYDAVGNGNNTAQIGNTNTTLVNTSGTIKATGARFHYTATAVNLTLTTNNYYVKVTGAGAVTITLPAATGLDGQRFVIANKNSGAITVNSASTIDGYGFTGISFSLPIAKNLIVFSDGTSWIVETNYL